MNKLNITKFFCVGLAAMSMAACSDDDKSLYPTTDGGEVGEKNDVFSAAEWFPGGELATTSNEQGCYSNESPAVDQQGLYQTFKNGEEFFDHDFTVASAPFKGLGPAYVRPGCEYCHPSYGHGWRQDTYSANTRGNGYLLVVYHKDADKQYNENGNPMGKDGKLATDAKDGYVSQIVGMPQTGAISPFLPPLEDNIPITWKKATDEHNNTFPDGEKYDLKYPEIDPNALKFNLDPQPDRKNMEVRLESTIGIYGTALIDAISNEDLEKQYKEEGKYVTLNPAMFNNETKEMAPGAYYTQAVWGNQEKRIKRFTYTLTRGSLEDGPGANAIWNITNVTRSDRRAFYSTPAYAKAMSENDEVVNAIMKSDAAWLKPYKGATVEETREKINKALSMTAPYVPTNTGANKEFHDMGFEDEMSDKDYYEFMVWHRGLAVPQARDLNTAKVKRGKQLFTEMGCVQCHKPSWTTGDDNYYQDGIVKGMGKLPVLAHQTIWPYSDFIQHRLDMKNNVRTGWCRTTPLWGRGLSALNTGHEDRLHDCRASNEIEAIMWHGYSKNSDAYAASQKFYHLSKADRDAVVAFIRAI